MFLLLFTAIMIVDIVVMLIFPRRSERAARSERRSPSHVTRCKRARVFTREGARARVCDGVTWVCPGG